MRFRNESVFMEKNAQKTKPDRFGSVWTGPDSLFLSENLIFSWGKNVNDSLDSLKGLKRPNMYDSPLTQVPTRARKNPLKVRSHQKTHLSPVRAVAQVLLINVSMFTLYGIMSPLRVRCERTFNQQGGNLRSLGHCLKAAITCVGTYFPFKCRTYTWYQKPSLPHCNDGATRWTRCSVVPPCDSAPVLWVWRVLFSQHALFS